MKCPSSLGTCLSCSSRKATINFLSSFSWTQMGQRYHEVRNFNLLFRYLCFSHKAAIYICLNLRYSISSSSSQRYVVTLVLLRQGASYPLIFFSFAFSKFAAFRKDNIFVYKPGCETFSILHHLLRPPCSLFPSTKISRFFTDLCLSCPGFNIYAENFFWGKK